MNRPWKMRAYYGSKAKPPKVPGTLAIQTEHPSESSLAMDVAAAEAREDIGRVETWRERDRFAW